MLAMNKSPKPTGSVRTWSFFLKYYAVSQYNRMRQGFYFFILFFLITTLHSKSVKLREEYIFTRKFSWIFAKTLFNIVIGIHFFSASLNFLFCF